MTDTTETVQEAFDRRAAEHHRLVDTPLPDGWLELCMEAGLPGLPADMSLEEAERRVRAIVNVVLPLYKQQVCNEVAAELERQAHRAAVADVDGPDCVEARTWTAAAEVARGAR